MSGRATPMMDVSMMTMNCASAMTARAIQRRGLTAVGMRVSLGPSAPVSGWVDAWTDALLTAGVGARGGPRRALVAARAGASPAAAHTRAGRPATVGTDGHQTA